MAAGGRDFPRRMTLPLVAQMTELTGQRGTSNRGQAVRVYQTRLSSPRGKNMLMDSSRLASEIMMNTI